MLLWGASKETSLDVSECLCGGGVADGSALVVNVTRMGSPPKRQAVGSPLWGRSGHWRRALPVTRLSSFPLAPSYRCTVDGTHPVTHLPTPSFHVILLHSAHIYCVPALRQAPC